MRERARQPEAETLAEPRATPSCGKIFPIPNETPAVTAAEFAAGMSVWSGDILLAYGPDGALYYATLAGDGQVHRIVTSSPR